MAILEGRWDCTACGRVANMGHELHCSGCGRPRGAVKFYLPPNAEEVVAAEKLAEAKAGPDWVCGYCQASNRSTSVHCTGCGAAREDGKARVEGGGDATEFTDAQRDQQRQAQQNAAVLAQKSAQSRNWNRTLGGIGCAIAIFFCCGGGGLFAFMGRFGGHAGTGGPVFRLGSPGSGAWVTVISRTARRTVVVEANELVREDAWCSSMPAGAHELSRMKKKDGERCEWRPRGAPLTAVAAPGFFGTKDLGNGYFESSPDRSSSSSSSSSDSSSHESSCAHIPTYADWCSYEAMKWHTVRSPSMDSALEVPDWPKISLAANERESARKEEFLYEVRVSDGEQVPLTAPDAATWNSMVAGSKHAATFSIFGGLKDVGASM